MTKLPKFTVYGKDNPVIEEEIQPHLEFRKWTDLGLNEKEIALQQLVNDNWIDDYSTPILNAIEHLNYYFLRQCPGKNLHQVIPSRDMRFGNEGEKKRAALRDFENIFLHEKSEAMVLRMLTKFAEGYIDEFTYGQAGREENAEKRNGYLEDAFHKFDALARCFNHIFEQFAIDKIFTRNGLMPRQDEKITQLIYVPTLQILADPKWKNVSTDLAEMFSEYRDGKYPEVITKAHRVIQRFLQILVGEEGKNGQGEVGKLFSIAKNRGIIPINRFTEPIINVFQGFISSERATKSTAKPAIKKATASDALLIMNVVMIFLQHCLQENKL